MKENRIARAVKKRIAYVLFPFFLYFTLACFGVIKVEIKAGRGGIGTLNEAERIAYGSFFAVATCVTAWYAYVQLRRDLGALKSRTGRTKIR